MPKSGAIGFSWQAEEVRKRSNGELDMQFFGGTLLSKELEIMNAVKSGNIQMGNPAGAAATVFPEMGVFLVPYLVQSYAHAYKMFNGAIGDTLDKQFQEKYKLKVMCFFDYGFRHFWTSKKAIIEPKDLRGAKIRVQQAKVFGDTINGLGGNAVPMAWGEVISAAKSGVIDGGDLPIVNQIALKIYEVSKYCSMTFHNYGPTLNTMNLATWESLSPAHKKLMLDTSREAQDKIRQLTESVDNFAAAKKELEPKGMTVVEAKVEDFRKVARPRSGRPTSRSSAACGTRSKASRPEARRVGSSANSISSIPKIVCRPSLSDRRHRQPADRRVPALRHDPGDRLARRRFIPLHLGRGGRRDAARLAHPDRRGDRRARAQPLHPARAAYLRRAARRIERVHTLLRHRRRDRRVVRRAALLLNQHAGDARPGDQPRGSTPRPGGRRAAGGLRAVDDRRCRRPRPIASRRVH